MQQMKKIFKILKQRLTLYDLISIIFIPLILFINLFVGKSIKKKHIWLISEDKDEACDNGYILFKYIKENRSDINCFYVINFKAKDYLKIKQYKTIIKYKSLKHWLYYLNSDVIIQSQDHTNPFPLLFYFLHKKNIMKTPRVYLKHGITKDNNPTKYYDKMKYRLFTCGALGEYNFVSKYFGFPDGNVVYTGFARFDNLDITSSKIMNNILITPTWRSWFNNQEEIEEYIDTYNKLLSNKILIDYIEKNNITVYFVLHKNMKKFKDKFLNTSQNIYIYNNIDIDIQELINKTDLLVTDYSSIFFDIAYRQRPMIFYQFDLDKYRKDHYQEGFFSYERDGFGPVVYTEEKLINNIIKYCDNKYMIENKYLNRMTEFFPKRDKNNSYRIVMEVEKILEN